MALWVCLKKGNLSGFELPPSPFQQTLMHHSQIQKGGGGAAACYYVVYASLIPWAPNELHGHSRGCWKAFFAWIGNMMDENESCTAVYSSVKSCCKAKKFSILHSFIFFPGKTFAVHSSLSIMHAYQHSFDLRSLVNTSWQKLLAFSLPSNQFTGCFSSGCWFGRMEAWRSLTWPEQMKADTPALLRMTEERPTARGLYW